MRPLSNADTGHVQSLTLIAHLTYHTIRGGSYAAFILAPSRRGQIWSWLRFSASHHDFIFGEPLDPVGDHRWNFELAVCGLFRAFSRP